MSSGHWNGKYYAIEHGTNSRLDEVHAAILLKKLPYLEVKNISGINCALFSKRNKNVTIKNKKGRLA